MRTPNTACVVCGKPLYRRPSDMARSRYAACMEHRALAQSLAGVTPAQAAGLALGRKKGTNHRHPGYRHSEATRRKIAASNKAFCAANPEAVAARGQKVRGAQHYQWKGGITRLNQSIRQMTENRRWMDAIKARDGRCVRCGATSNLEAHHKVSLAALIEQLGIRSRADARRHAAALWDMENGETLCVDCHYAEHGRMRRAA